MRARHVLIVALITVGAGAALGLGAVSAGPRGVAEPAPAAPAQPPEAVPRGGRISFAGRAQPIAQFPDGRRRAIASILSVAGPLSYGEFVWNDAGVPAGRAWVQVDLDAQILSVFRGNHEIGTAVVLYGADDKPTPLGAFPILAKLRDHVSSLYDAPMPYTLRLTGDGVAIHGSNVRSNAATHGCVGVPSAFAARLFKELKLGDEVVIVRGKAGSRSGTATPVRVS